MINLMQELKSKGTVSSGPLISKLSPHQYHLGTYYSCKFLDATQIFWIRPRDSDAQYSFVF